MPTFYIMRHADAQSIKHFSSDKERTLSKKGHDEANKILPLIQNTFKKITLVLCSSSLRTRETLVHILPSLSSVTKILYLDTLYHADHEEILEEFNHYLDKYSDILIVGHNPGVSDFYHKVAINSESKSPRNNLESLPTSSVVEYSHNCLDIHVRFSDLRIKDVFLPTDADTALK